MIGCSFVANRHYFGELGLLDSGMDVYGGENIELGIRVSVPKYLHVLFTALTTTTGWYEVFNSWEEHKQCKKTKTLLCVWVDPRFGCVEEVWRSCHALGWLTSPERRSRTTATSLFTPGAMHCGWLKYGWTSTSLMSTWLGTFQQWWGTGSEPYLFSNILRGDKSTLGYAACFLWRFIIHFLLPLCM